MNTSILDRNAQLSTLSHISYLDGEPEKIGGWHKYEDNEKDPSGFSAVVYVNSKTRKIAIAFRGTDDLSDVIPDVGYAFGGWSEQYSNALKFTKKISAASKTLKFRTRFGTGEFELLVTGHSHGGALSQI
jgi:hypothetical protein